MRKDHVLIKETRFYHEEEAGILYKVKECKNLTGFMKNGFRREFFNVETQGDLGCVEQFIMNEPDTKERCERLKDLMETKQ